MNNRPAGGRSSQTSSRPIYTTNNNNNTEIENERLVVHKAVKMSMLVFWILSQYGLVGRY
jgi:hypothetical protein